MHQGSSNTAAGFDVNRTYIKSKLACSRGAYGIVPDLDAEFWG